MKPLKLEEMFNIKPKFLLIFCCILAAFILTACKSEAKSQALPPQALPPILKEEKASSMQESTKIKLTIGDKAFTATPTENAAAEAFMELINNSPITIEMHEHGGFEKFGALEADLPANDSNITTNAGDIVLYNNNQIVVFYGSNTWSYTPIAKIDNLSGLDKALGTEDVTITFSGE